MTTTCVGAWGLRSRNASVVSVSCTTSAGMSPATILQNRQSVTPASCRPFHRRSAPPPASRPAAHQAANYSLQGLLCKGMLALMTEDQVRLRAATLKGIAHPLRVRLLDLLRED